jgi:hypothetical protein
VEKYGKAGQFTDGNIIRRKENRLTCVVTKAGLQIALEIFNTFHC